MKLTFLFIQVVLCLLLLAALEQGRVEAKTTTTTKRSKTTTDSTKAPKSTTTTKKSKTTTSPSFNCPTSNNNGVYADPDDCTHYYVCKDGEATNQACGPVLSVFDPNMGRCRLPVFIPSCIVGK